MRSFKILFLISLFVVTCISASAQTKAKNKPCDQKSVEKAQLIKETEKKYQYRVKRIEFVGNEFIRDRVLREKLAFEEGDIFTKELLEKSIKNLSKSKELYPISLKDVRIYLDKSSKDIGLVFCVKER
jgi:outer membrane protein assembly factor BamA